MSAQPENVIFMCNYCKKDIIGNKSIKILFLKRGKTSLMICKCLNIVIKYSVKKQLRRSIFLSFSLLTYL